MRVRLREAGELEEFGVAVFDVVEEGPGVDGVELGTLLEDFAGLWRSPERRWVRFLSFGLNAAAA